MSKSKLSQLTDPKKVAEAAKKRSSPEFAMLAGSLGAIEKGGRTVANDESTVQKAAHYGRVLAGIEKQKLGEKHYGEIAELIKSFLIGPEKVKKTAATVRRAFGAFTIEFDLDYEIPLAGIEAYAKSCGMVEEEIELAKRNLPENMHPSELEMYQATGIMDALVNLGCLYLPEDGAHQVRIEIDNVQPAPYEAPSIYSPGSSGGVEDFEAKYEGKSKADPYLTLKQFFGIDPKRLTEKVDDYVQGYEQDDYDYDFGY